jgi:hypothetical protein
MTNSKRIAFNKNSLKKAIASVKSASSRTFSFWEGRAIALSHSSRFNAIESSGRQSSDRSKKSAATGKLESIRGYFKLH